MALITELIAANLSKGFLKSVKRCHSEHTVCLIYIHKHQTHTHTRTHTYTHTHTNMHTKSASIQLLVNLYFLLNHLFLFWILKNHNRKSVCNIKPFLYIPTNKQQQNIYLVICYNACMLNQKTRKIFLFTDDAHNTFHYGYSGVGHTVCCSCLFALSLAAHWRTVYNTIYKP